MEQHVPLVAVLLPLTVLAIGSLATAFASESEDAVPNIGSRRELFIDHLLIDRLEGTELQLQQPQPGGSSDRVRRADRWAVLLLHNRAQGRRHLPHVLPRPSLGAGMD